MYIKRAYHHWRAFFWIIIIALSAQVFFMIRGIENVPFFLYHMYSYAHQPIDSFNIILMKTNAGYLDPYELSGRESEMLMNNITYYNNMKKAAYQDGITTSVEQRFKTRVPIFMYNYLREGLINDSVAFSGYTGWWQRYFSGVYKHSFDSLSIVSSCIKYRPNHTKSPVDSTIFTCYFR